MSAEALTDEALMRLADNRRLRVQDPVVAIPTKTHSCEARCGAQIVRGEPCVSLTIRKPSASFTNRWHLACAPASLSPRPLPERRALRYLSRALSAPTVDAVPEVAWTVLATLRNASCPF